MSGWLIDWQAYWGNQNWADTQRIKPVIDEVDRLGVRSNTYIRAAALRLDLTSLFCTG